MKLDTSIRFSWYGILRKFNFDCEKALRNLNTFLTEGYSEYDLQVMQYITKNNDCWLAKPIEFVVSGATNQQKCVYLHIATRRNWMEFVENGTTSVPMYVVEDMYNINTLRTNPLLTVNVSNDTIDLKY